MAQDVLRAESCRASLLVAAELVLSRAATSTPEYWVCVITRNGEETIGATLDSLIKQTRPPKLIVVVDDGSNDQTELIVNRRKKRNIHSVHTISLPDRGYDIRRVPSNINAAYTYVKRLGQRFGYGMISGDDCIYPTNYSEYLLSRMEENPTLAIASGDWGVKPPPDMVKAPQGAGRFIREHFWEQIGGQYPVAYGWETWALFKAMQLGYSAANFTELRYVHMRPSGTAHKFAHWGAAMRSLGYYPFMVWLRVAKNILLASEPIPIRGNLSMLASYLLTPLSHKDPYFRYYEKDLREFVRRQQVERVRAFARRFVRRLGI